MSDSNQFVELNNLVQAENGVFYRNTIPQEFKYSDGAQIEMVLEGILSKTTDLSSQSNELQTQIVDWPTEYHLSSARSNLLRIVNLTGAKRVLELGCGCGSITRYLGEQEGLTVDSVEGSPERANLAALRCRDLSNVTIATANFNDLDLPNNYYDLVLFVGVTEYAGRFSKRDTDHQALQDLLALAHNATTSNGVTLVAIENRVGLKYLHGANEDHFAAPYIGLKGYPESEGIRTYTKGEWQDQIDESLFIESKFLYPFPDYKIPTVIFDDSVASDAEKIESLLENITSRDYGSDFTFGVNELMLWSAMASAGTLSDHSNSFLIFLAKQANAIESSILASEFKHEVPLPNYLEIDSTMITKFHEKNERVDYLDDELKDRNTTIQHLKSELGQLRGYINLIEGSRGGRVLAFLRRCLGR